MTGSPPTPSAAPSAAPTAAPSASAPASPWPPAKLGPATPTTLAVLAEGWGLDVVVAAGKASIFDQYATAWADLDGGAPSLVKDAFAGLPTDMPNIRHAGGVASGATFASVDAAAMGPTLYVRGRSGFEKVGAWNKDGWTSGYWVRDASPMASLVLVPDGAGPGAVVPLPVPGGGDIRMKGPGRRTFELARFFSAEGTASGDLLAAGERAKAPGEASGALVVVHFPAGATEPRVLPVPSPLGPEAPREQRARLCAREGVGVFAIVEAKLGAGEPRAFAARFSGGAWAPHGRGTTTAQGAHLAACAVAPDGSVWAAWRGDAARVTRLGVDGEWSDVALPAVAPVKTWTTIPSEGRGRFTTQALPPKSTQGIRVDDVVASDTGEVFVKGTRTLNGMPMTPSDEIEWVKARTLVLRTGEPPKGAPFVWEKLAGDTLGKVNARLSR